MTTMTEDITNTDTGAQMDAPEGVDLEALKTRFAITAPLAYHTEQLPVARLVLAEELPGGPGAFASNFELVGILHPLSVVPLPDTDAPQNLRWRVVTGRRRLRDARAAALTYVECHVYEDLTRQQEALLILSENARRSSAWVEETRQLRALIGQVGMTTRELSKVLGISHATARERLAMAMLPEELFEAAARDRLARSTTHKLTTLKASQQEIILARVRAGEKLTGALILAALRTQQNVMAAPLSVAIDASPVAPVTPIPAPPTAPRKGKATTPSAAPVEQPEPVPVALPVVTEQQTAVGVELAALRSMTKSFTALEGMAGQKVRLLHRALIEALEVLA